MEIMFIFHNHEDLHPVLGKVTVRFVTKESELLDAINNMNWGLCREEFRGDIPTMTLVERFERRASLTGPGEHGNDYVFVNAWQAPISREQAFKQKYGAIQ
jgi:hypothetical protein